MVLLLNIIQYNLKDLRIVSEGCERLHFRPGSQRFNFVGYPTRWVQYQCQPVEYLQLGKIPFEKQIHDFFQVFYGEFVFMRVDSQL